MEGLEVVAGEGDEEVDGFWGDVVVLGLEVVLDPAWKFSFLYFFGGEEECFFGELFGEGFALVEGFSFVGEEEGWFVGWGCLGSGGGLLGGWLC